MKFYVILLFFISQNILGQNIPSKITFKDGVTFEGFAEITKKGGILFSLERNTNGDIYGATELSRIEFIEYSGNRVFEYVRVLNRKREKFLLMEIIESGKISLFHHYEVKKRFDPNSNYLFLDNTNNGLLTFPFSSNNFPKNTGGKWEKIYVVKKFLRVKGENIAIKLKYETSEIKNTLTEYFANCPYVLEELEIVDFQNYNIEDLVWLYNRDCSDANFKSD